MSFILRFTQEPYIDGSGGAQGLEFEMQAALTPDYIQSVTGEQRDFVPDQHTITIDPEVLVNGSTVSDYRTQIRDTEPDRLAGTITTNGSRIVHADDIAAEEFNEGTNTVSVRIQGNRYPIATVTKNGEDLTLQSVDFDGTPVQDSQDTNTSNAEPGPSISLGLGMTKTQAATVGGIAAAAGLAYIITR